MAGLLLVLLLAALVPLAIGRWLTDHEHDLELAELAAVEASALALLAGRSPEGG